MNKLLTILFLGIGFAFSQNVKRIASLPKELKETSGLVMINDSTLATHNDSGGEAKIYFINLSGKIVHKLKLKGVDNKDWEDLCLAENGDLLVGDIGDNLNHRNSVSIYRITNSDFDKEECKPKRIKFKYPEKRKGKVTKQDSLYFDAEAMFAIKDSVYIFTKNRTVPFDGKILVYAIPLKEGKQKAKLSGVIQICSAGWQTCSVTGADYNPKTDNVSFITYKYVFEIEDFSKRNWEVKKVNTLHTKQREGICYSKDGNSIYLTDEKHRILGGGNLYQWKRK